MGKKQVRFKFEDSSDTIDYKKKTLARMSEAYPCYVRIGGDETCEEVVELPTEKDGTMLLSTIQAQYPDSIGLRFKSEAGGWRGVRCEGNVLDVPLEGWGDKDYIIVLPKKGKRKLDESAGPGSKVSKVHDNLLQDLIVLGLPFSATEDDMKSYFEQFGELDMHEIKFDPIKKKSKGFGFIRFKSAESVEAVLAADHVIMNRRCEVKYPDKKQDENPTKLFVGRLPKGTSNEDLREHFSQFGVLTDVYIPSPFRNFGFVTFASPAAAREVMYATNVIKGIAVNVSYPQPKGQKSNMMMDMPSQYGYGGMQQGNMMGNMAGNMQRNMPGNMQGNMQGNMLGNMQGGMSGNMPGNMAGNMQGNIPMQQMQARPGPGYGYGTPNNLPAGKGNGGQWSY